jgi:hypothetical protein
MKLIALAVDSYRDPAWLYPAVFGGLAVIVAFFWLLDRLLNHFFPSAKRYHASAGNALLRVEANFLPGREHIVEACKQDIAEEDDQGEPPETGDAKQDRRN